MKCVVIFPDVKLKKNRFPRINLFGDVERADRLVANMAHIRQSRPDSCLGVQEKVLETFSGVPPSLESGVGGLVFKAHKLLYHSSIGSRMISSSVGGLVFKAHRRMHRPTLGLRVIKKKQVPHESTQANIIKGV